MLKNAGQRVIAFIIELSFNENCSVSKDLVLLCRIARSGYVVLCTELLCCVRLLDCCQDHEVIGRSCIL